MSDRWIKTGWMPALREGKLPAKNERNRHRTLRLDIIDAVLLEIRSDGYGVVVAELHPSGLAGMQQQEVWLTPPLPAGHAQLLYNSFSDWVAMHGEQKVYSTWELFDVRHWMMANYKLLELSVVDDIDALIEKGHEIRKGWAADDRALARAQMQTENPPLGGEETQH